MLTPAVRAAAAQYAATQDHPVSGAVEHGWLVGYCAGTRAPRAARFPLAGDQALKRLLGQYLAENTTVYHPATGRYGLLRGLPATYEGQGEPLADVEFYADAEARAEGGGDALEDAGKILPCLYGFEDLATEILLADGRRVVPAVEVAKLIMRRLSPAVLMVKCECYLNGDIVVRDSEGDVRVQIERFGTGWYLGRYGGLAEYQLLLSYGFAVGLRPDQYRRRVVGFDYASGERPKVHNCALHGCAKLTDVAGPTTDCGRKGVCNA